MDIDETGETAKFQPQTFKVARYCARKKVEENGVEEVAWGPASNQNRSTQEVLSGDRSGGGSGGKRDQYEDSRRQLRGFPGRDTNSGIAIGVGAGALVAPGAGLIL